MAAKALNKLKGVSRFATVVHGGGAGGLNLKLAAQALAEGTLSRNTSRRNISRKPSARAPRGVMVEFDGERLAEVEAGVHAPVKRWRWVCAPLAIMSANRPTFFFLQSLLAALRPWLPKWDCNAPSLARSASASWG